MNKKILTFASILFCAVFAFAQEEEPEIDIDQLEKEANEEQKTPEVDPELQKNFIIIESTRQHELNPQITNYASDSQILCGLYEGLFSYNPVTLDPQYAICKDVKISRDKKRWQFILRDDAYFSNGEKITAESVQSSFLQMLANPDAPYASLLDMIRGAKEFRLGQERMEDVGIYVTSENTVSFYLNTPANYLPKILCHSAFSIVHRTPTVYSGAYELEDYNQSEYILKKNEYYWDAKNVHLERITFRQTDDKEESAYLFNTGAADWLTSDIGKNVILDNQALQMNAVFGTGFLYFRMSGTNMSVWDYADFRNAVIEAFPWEIIRKTSLVPASTLVYPLAGYPQVDGFEFTDEIEASLKMSDARKKFNIPAEQIIPLRITVFENEFNDEQKDAIKNALQPLGIEVQIVEIPSAYYYAVIPQAQSDMFISSWIGDFADPLAFLELFRGGSTMNDSHWQNKEFDELLEKADSVTDDLERYKLLGQAEDILLDEGIVLPIYRSVSLNVIDLKEVGGWASNAFDIHPLKYLYKKAEKVNIPNVVLK